MVEKVHNNYRKVRKEGGARVLALTPFIPKDWKIVKVDRIGGGKTNKAEWVTLAIERVV